MRSPLTHRSPSARRRDRATAGYLRSTSSTRWNLVSSGRPRVVTIYRDNETQEFFDEANAAECRTCDGEGDHECSVCDAEHTCGDCGGSGRGSLGAIDKERMTLIGYAVVRGRDIRSRIVCADRLHADAVLFYLAAFSDEAIARMFDRQRLAA
jgi:hypothetical protein